MPYFCYQCGTEWTGSSKPARSDICKKCGAVIRCCRNCAHYSPSLHNQCEIPEAEYVGDKERANFCEWFEFRESDSTKASGEPQTRQEQAKKRWEELFKDE